LGNKFSLKEKNRKCSRIQ